MRKFHDVITVADITEHMTREIIKRENWRPNNPTIPCGDKPCYPPDPRDRGENAPHTHIAVRMLVPIAVSASVIMGNVRVVE